MSWNDPISPCIAILFIFQLSLVNFQLSIYKKLRFHLVCEAEPYLSIFNLQISINLTYGFPLHRSLQSKNNNRKSKRSYSTLFCRFCLIGCKSIIFSVIMQAF